MTTMQLREKIHGMPARDGAGVKLTRSVGARPGLRVDPFLMLDEFSSDEASDYIAGFPPHPHRGFQTVTYMLDGHMRHEDHLGNTGHLKPGGVQWMVAGRGIIHSEMPEQQEGRMRGFQLWVNLPAQRKMEPPSYQDLQASEIPQFELAEGVQAKLIAGQLEMDGEVLQGAIAEPSTRTLYLDLRLQAGRSISLPVPEAMEGFVYPYEGRVEVAGEPLSAHTAGVLLPGECLDIASSDQPAAMLVILGLPLKEPVAQYGPFVMNTREEILQAREDYALGRLTESH